MNNFRWVTPTPLFIFVHRFRLVETTIML